MKSWVLQNPRGHVQWARISQVTEKHCILAYGATWGRTYDDWARTHGSAKSIFSRNVLQPKYHGKNIWKEE